MIYLLFLFIWFDWSSYPLIMVHTNEKVDYIVVNDTLYKPFLSNGKIKVAVIGRIKFPELLDHKNLFDISIFDNNGNVLWTNTDFIGFKEIDPFANINFFLEGNSPKIVVSDKVKKINYKRGVMFINPQQFFALLDSIKDIKTYIVSYNSPIMDCSKFSVKAIISSGKYYADSFQLKDIPLVWEIPSRGKEVYCSKNIVVVPPYVYLINGKEIFKGMDNKIIDVENNTIFFENYALRFIGYKKWENINYKIKGKLIDTDRESFLFKKGERYYFYSSKDTFSFPQFEGKFRIYKNGVLMLSNGRLNYFGRSNFSVLRWKNVKDFTVYDNLIGILADSSVYVIDDKGGLLYETRFKGKDVSFKLNKKYLAISNERGVHVFNIKTKEEVLWHPVRWRRNIKKIPLSLYNNKIAFIEGNKLYYRVLP